MSAADVANALGDARREGRGWRCRCPLHGGRSLVVRDGDRGNVLVMCWGGCDRLSVLAELRRRRLLGHGGATYRPPTVIPSWSGADVRDDARRTARALAIWRESRDVQGSPVARYLAGRGIVFDAMPESLRYHPRCPRPDGTYMPAMVALVEHVERGIVGIHRTYVTAGHRRYDRATLGPIGGGAVRLGILHAGEWLAIAEGIETALAVAVACGMPAWSALSAGGIRVLILPSEATNILICADHDASGVGQRAAHDAAARWLSEGHRVRIAVPPAPDTDMADVLAAAAIEVRHVA